MIFMKRKQDATVLTFFSNTILKKLLTNNGFVYTILDMIVVYASCRI